MVCASGCCPSTSSDQVDWRMIHSISSGLIATSQQIISKTSITRSAAECKLLTWCRCPFGRWLFFAIEKNFKTGCSKRDFLSDEIEGLFRRNANRQRRRGNVNDLWIFSKRLLKIAFPWPMQWGDFFEGHRSKRKNLSDQIEGVIAGRKISSPLNKKICEGG